MLLVKFKPNSSHGSVDKYNCVPSTLGFYTSEADITLAAATAAATYLA